MSRLLCRLFGHPGFVRGFLPEPPGVRIVSDRDPDGRALAWPECIRCGHRLFWTTINEDRSR